jgi:hypothetical protein
MVYFKRDRFAGIAPGVSPRLLADQFGQIAENIDFESGRLVSTKTDTVELTLASSTKNSIYKYEYGTSDSAWLQWNEDGVSVVPGPIPGDTTDRLYFTGQTYPRIGWADTLISGSSYPSVSYRLGVPAPTVRPTVTITGTITDGTNGTVDMAALTPNDVSYVYTLVTGDGREGPPSLPSVVTEMVDGQTATITMTNDTQTGAHNLGAGTTVNGVLQNSAFKRLYRSNTGSTSTQFQLCKDNIPIGATSTTDQKDAATLGEVLPSDTWIGPPDNDTDLYPDGQLKGLIPLAQGVMAGFTGKRFCLSEPFLPHAWPIQYRITTEEDIVAIASTSNGVAALTDGQPYFITGTDPSAMTAIRIDLAQACVNEHSVVDMGSYVLYAGPDGLCAIESSQGSVVTDGQISVKQWNADFSPTTYRAFRHEGTYVAFYAGGGWVYDPRGGEAALSKLDISTVVRGGYRNPKDGQLYIIVGNKIKKYQGGSTNNTLKFKSKKFVTPAPVSMGWVSVHADVYPVTVKVYGDGTLLAHYTLTKSGSTYTQATTVPSNISDGTLREPIMRMPAVVAQEWEIQVEGTDINEFCLAQSMEEIRTS